MKFAAPVAIGVLSSIALLCAVGWSQAAKLQEYDDSEGYAVLSLLLDHYHWIGITRVLIISPATSSGLVADSFESCKQVPDEFKLAARDFEDKNKHNWRLVKQFKLNLEYEFADKIKRNVPPPPVPGEQELPLPPDPINVVSAVGFDSSRTHAIAYLAAFGAPYAASGGYHLVVKDKMIWREVDQSPVCEFTSFRVDDSPARGAL